jgi:SAM-dependent methyltransferase
MFHNEQRADYSPAGRLTRKAAAMNRYHRRCCRSSGWSAYIAGTVLPRALDGIDLGPRVLELGPGYGASTRPLAARAPSLTVLEYDRQLAARLRAELGSVRVVHGDATSMGFGAGSFSAVVCFTMLHHLPGPAAQDRLFAEAARVLRPGGVFAGTDSRPSLRWRLIHLGDICTPIDPGTLPARLGAAGFTRVAVDADERMVRFVAYTPGAEGEARHDRAA